MLSDGMGEWIDQKKREQGRKGGKKRGKRLRAQRERGRGKKRKSGREGEIKQGEKRKKETMVTEESWTIVDLASLLNFLLQNYRSIFDGILCI